MSKHDYWYNFRTNINNADKTNHVGWHVLKSVMTVVKTIFFKRPLALKIRSGTCCISGCTLIIISGWYFISPLKTSLKKKERMWHSDIQYLIKPKYAQQIVSIAKNICTNSMKCQQLLPNINTKLYSKHCKMQPNVVFEKCHAHYIRIAQVSSN